MRLNPTISEIQAPPLRSNMASHLLEKYIDKSGATSKRQTVANHSMIRILKEFEDMGGKL